MGGMNPGINPLTLDAWLAPVADLSSSNSSILSPIPGAFHALVRSPARPAAPGRPGVAGHRPPAPPSPEGQPDPLDPLARQTAQLGPPPVPCTPAGAAAPCALAPVRATVEDLLPQLVRRVAWSGDGRRGAIRLELGAGHLAGAEIVVEAVAGQVRVHLRAPDGVDLAPWRERIARRLAARGLDVGEVKVE